MPADQSGGGDDLDVLSSTDWPAVHISTNQNNHARPWYRVFVYGGQELRRRGESADAHLLHNNQLRWTWQQLQRGQLIILRQGLEAMVEIY